MGGRGWFLIAVVLTLLAGCLDGPATESADRPARARTTLARGDGMPTLDDPALGARVRVYDKDGQPLVEPPSFPTPIDVSVSSIGARCGEPTGGVTWKNDYLWQVCLADVYRSTDHGASWQEVSTQVSSPTTLDPYMWVDTITDRVYSVQLYVGCSYLAYTDDYGATWVPNPIACGIPVNDHQTMAGGPPAAPMVSNPVYRNHLYYCVNQIADTMCARSFDGGLTWTGTVAQAAVVDVEAGRGCSAINGHVVVGKDGTAYLPKRQCTRPVVLVSTNNGLTWEERVISRAHPVVQSLAHDPTVATDSAGNAYYFWTADDGVLRLSASTNKGQTWSAPFRVAPPGMTMSMFETSVAGDPGRVAVAYYGTSQPRDQRWKYASQAPNETVWHLYLTIVEDALGENPRITTVQVNPTEDPIQRGCIWLQGGGSPCRNLLDFFDTSMGKDGRVYIHFADGCVDKCVTWNGEGPIPRTSLGAVGIVQSGPSLFQETPWLAPFPAKS